MVIPDSKIQEAVCVRKLGNSVSDILELYNRSKNFVEMSYSGEGVEILNSICTAPFPTTYTLHISKHYLKSIIDKIGNCLLEWTIRLESEGILGENMRFSQEEQNMAKKCPSR